MWLPLCCGMAAVSMAAPAVVLDTADGASLFFGTLASKAERIASIATAGVNVATLGVD